MALQETNLDEISWRAPEVHAQMSGIHENSVLFYFAASPFFDSTSNNAVLFNQAMYNPNLTHVLATRGAFEGRLKTMSGLEFMIAEQPAEMAPGTGTGVWVIRKQTRRKRQGDDDEILVHSTYFVVGENIYMAPAVGDVLGSRMLQILSSLNKFITISATLPDFSPALGHTYLPPPSSKSSKGPESQLAQGSKEPTPLPDAFVSNKKSLQPSNQSVHSDTYTDNRLLEESLNIALRYGDEYMDENVITGQPGDFHLATLGRKDKDKLMVPLQTKLSTATTATKPGAPPEAPPGAQPEAPVLPSLKTDNPPARKGSKPDKSPRTPGAPKPKKRKSTKGLASGGISPI